MKSRFFDDDIETKWGVSIDPELKENVKVTILATGFGMKVEDGKMNITDKNEQSVEEMRKTRQKKDAEDALIDSQLVVLRSAAAVGRHRLNGRDEVKTAR